MLIEVKALELNYEVRKIDPNRSWLRHLFWAEYAKHPVLRGLDLKIGRSGITAILGKNGAGKTTLMKILGGILTPSSGFVSVLGFEPRRRNSSYLRQIGAVFGQKKMLWPELSLRENFKITQAIYRVAKLSGDKRASELAKMFALEALMDRPVKTLSLGESMRAELANTLLYEPKILLLDEPTIGLDVGSQAMIRRLIKDYVRQHQCHILLTSHNTRDVIALANQILILESGRLTEFKPKEFASPPEEQLEQRLISL